ncbi:MAG: ABC transporter ATP-binding protein [Rhizobiaceae bacterium]|nr:ABC transporter ATP-binding protein [Rhizobiaceae bacterium]|tara:strand:+ start:43309 stop:44130 length:822 start_codon:yes stop_codon:yes gene_type:complete
MTAASKPNVLPTPDGVQSSIRMDDVSLVYKSGRGNVEALADLSLDLKEGEFLSVLGPSGCGKSTILKILSGLLPVTKGKVLIDGAELKGPRGDIGIVFQQPTLLAWQTNLQNVLMPVRASKRPTASDRERALKLLELVGLEEFANHYPYELSGGMQQRVGIARGLINDPRVLLMDEPFAALDAMSRETMTTELQQIWMATNRSVVFITHSIPEAVFLSNRVVTLSGRPGRVVDDLTIDLPFPRTIDTMSTQPFNEYCHHLRALFQAKEKRQQP